MSRNKQLLSLFYCNKRRLLHLNNKQATFAAYRYKKHSTKATVNPKIDWSRAVTDAEKIIGCPTSFLNLRWLLSDEIANVAIHLQKLVGSSHPLLKTAKSLIYNENYNMQAWGLIVLLVSKAAGQINNDHVVDDELDDNKVIGVLNRQRELAKITEMIRAAHLVHDGLVNLKEMNNLSTEELNDMTFGNKIALLSGDYLLGTSCMKLSLIKNHPLLELMSLALKDLSESAFIGRRDNQNKPLPSIPSKNCKNYAIDEWTLKNYLSSASLLAKSCKGTLILAGHDEHMQTQAYEFGKNLALAWQASLDLSPFINKQTRNTQFDLSSAPVMFHIEYNASILNEIDKGLESVNNVDYPKIYDIITNGPGIELTKILLQDHSQKAMEILTSTFDESEARTALSNIIASIGDYRMLVCK